MTRPRIGSIAPCFISRNVPAGIKFYQLLGFEIEYQVPGDDVFFAIVQRDGAMIFLKSVEADPLPNSLRNASARWDAYMSVEDPDGLATEFLSRGLVFTSPLQDTHDGLRGFELKDADGYVRFFGRSR